MVRVVTTGDARLDVRLARRLHGGDFWELGSRAGDPVELEYIRGVAEEVTAGQYRIVLTDGPLTVTVLKNTAPATLVVSAARLELSAFARELLLRDWDPITFETAADWLLCRIAAVELLAAGVVNRAAAAHMIACLAAGDGQRVARVRRESSLCRNADTCDDALLRPAP